MSYAVRITPEAEASILEQARYIAVDQQAPLNAARWLSRVYDAAETLETWPRRCALAEEDALRPFEIRKLSIDGFFLLFTVLDDRQEVWVIAMRHGRMLPRPDELPEQTPE